MKHGDFAVASDHHRGRQPWADPKPLHIFGSGSEPYGKIDLSLLDELEHFHAVGNLIGGSTDDLNAKGRVFVLNRRQVWHFLLAGNAPGCPEVKHHDATTVSTQTLIDAREVFQIQLSLGTDRSLLAGARRC